jgi:hypothetical protein
VLRPSLSGHSSHERKATTDLRAGFHLSLPARESSLKRSEEPTAGFLRPIGVV